MTYRAKIVLRRPIHLLLRRSLFFFSCLKFVTKELNIFTQFITRWPAGLKSVTMAVHRNTDWFGLVILFVGPTRCRRKICFRLFPVCSLTSAELTKLKKKVPQSEV